MSIMVQIIEIMIGALSGIGEGIGLALSEMATAIFMTGTGDSQTLSVFGTLIIIFAGLSLAFGLSVSPLCM